MVAFPPSAHEVASDGAGWEEKAQWLTSQRGRATKEGEPQESFWDATEKKP